MNQAAFKFDENYPDGFWWWLAANNHIYKRFSVLALRMAQLGRKHYSARAIVHAIRWETDLRDTGRTFKINNNYTPGLARMWNEEYGAKYPNFFRCRESLGHG